MPSAPIPADVIRSSTPRPSSRLRQTGLSAASAFTVRSRTRSSASPRASSAATTFAAAPPRSEPGSGSRLPSARWAAAQRTIAWVSESLDIGVGSGLRRDQDHPGPLPPRAAPSPRCAAGGRRRQCPKAQDDRGDPTPRNAVPCRCTHPWIGAKAKQISRPCCCFCRPPDCSCHAGENVRRATAPLIVRMLSTPTGGRSLFAPAMEASGGAAPAKRLLADDPHLSARWKTAAGRAATTVSR